MNQNSEADVVESYFQAGIEFGIDYYGLLFFGKSTVFDRNLQELVELERAYANLGYVPISIEEFMEQGYHRMLERRETWGQLQTAVGASSTPKKTFIPKKAASPEEIVMHASEML